MKKYITNRANHENLDLCCFFFQKLDDSELKKVFNYSTFGFRNLYMQLFRKFFEESTGRMEEKKTGEICLSLCFLLYGI